MISAFTIEWNNSIRLLLIAVAAVLIVFAVVLLIILLKRKPETMVRVVKVPAVVEEKKDTKPTINLYYNQTTNQLNIQSGEQPEPVQYALPNDPEEIKRIIAAALNQNNTTDGKEVLRNTIREAIGERDERASTLPVIREDTLPVEADKVFKGPISYRKSFKAKLIQSGDTVKEFYTELKNELLSYSFNTRISWDNETFFIGRTVYARFGISGKTLSLYLALSPEEYALDKQAVAAKAKSVRSTPLRIRLYKPSAVNRAKTLIKVMAEKNGISRSVHGKRKYHIPYESADSLVRRRLIKVVNGVAPEYIPDLAIKEEPVAPVSCSLSFMAKLIESEQCVKNRYNLVKNELLRYGFTSKIYFGSESFKRGRDTVCKLCMSGKTVAVYLALDPAEFKGGKYKLRDCGDKKKFASTPLRMRLSSDRSAKHTKELIARLGEARGLTRADTPDVNQLPDFGKLVKIRANKI